MDIKEYKKKSSQTHHKFNNMLTSRNLCKNIVYLFGIKNVWDI